MLISLAHNISYKDKYDIFICGGSRHFSQLKTLLPLLAPFGRLHLGASILSAAETKELGRYCDHLHTPRYHQDGYVNFKLFCIRDINRLARAPYFIKLDADVMLAEDWIEYVDRGVREHRQAVLFGAKEGVARINLELTGTDIRQQFGQEIHVNGGQKVVGGFYVGETAFFKRHDQFMQNVHAWLHPDPRQSSEDTLRSLVVHAVGAGDKLMILDSQGRIVIPPCTGNHQSMELSRKCFPHEVTRRKHEGCRQDEQGFSE